MREGRGLSQEERALGCCLAMRCVHRTDGRRSQGAGEGSGSGEGAGEGERVG